MNILGVIGDVLWLLALSIMAGASRMAWGKVSDVLVPVLWGAAGKTLWRAPRAVALASLPTFAFLLSLWLLLESRQPQDTDWAIILLCVRAILAAIFAVIHLTQVRRALNQLAEEGQIKL
jgi:amino acid transporter